MTWNKEFIYVSQYQHTSGMHMSERFKVIGQKRMSVAVLAADISDASDLQDLVLLSDFLDVPVRYNFKSKPQTAFIKIVGAEDVSN